MEERKGVTQVLLIRHQHIYLRDDEESSWREDCFAWRQLEIENRLSKRGRVGLIAQAAIPAYFYQVSWSCLNKGQISRCIPNLPRR